jgi:hypothetical protein
MVAEDSMEEAVFTEAEVEGSSFGRRLAIACKKKGMQYRVTRTFELKERMSTVEFAFGLEPIFQLTARLLAALEIDFVCATSDFLVTRSVPYRRRCRFLLGEGRLGLCTAIFLSFR